MADRNCPFCEWLFDDAMVSSNGNYYCLARKDRQLGEYGGSRDRFPCDSDDHNSCRHFLDKQGGRIEDKLE